ncbi:hypothetical protein [Sporomusa malonica]|uniref:Uncharacterized protein n=1 Tax=Sporomusa malonica TaxID=112901 RepID=A0A1W2C501_9FIRM|nr:hypothetical protein [Sporomusa malonica]SMC80337.1 hypothetical protein SAMN04488500_109144 [Sporomusa malonica]
MTDTDQLIKEKVLPFREKMIGIIKEKHPYMYSVANSVLAGRKNKAGLQVTQEGQVIGEYTFHLDGIHIQSVECGKLDSGIHHPFLGLVKPYGVLERSTIEQMLEDEGFTSELFGTIVKYLPGVTIKFLR